MGRHSRSLPKTKEVGLRTNLQTKTNQPEWPLKDFTKTFTRVVYVLLGDPHQPPVHIKSNSLPDPSNLSIVEMYK